MPSDRSASRQAVQVALRPPEQGWIVHAELRFRGLSRGSGVQAQAGREFRDSFASHVAAKAVVLRQQIRLFLEQLINEGFGC